jgi:tRNA(fMet)-specific endonuclease VapC
VTYLLDTSILVPALNGREPLRTKLNETSKTEAVKTSVLVEAELRYGAEYSQRRELNLRHLSRQLAEIDVVPVTREMALRFGQLKADLRRRGLTKGDFDLMLAATAIEIGAVLVTNDAALLDNTILGLVVENWA